MQFIKNFLKELTPAKTIGIGLVILALAAIFLVLMLNTKSSEMDVLYSNLDIQDSGKIAQELDAKKIPYSVVGDGSVIKVPKSEVANVRMALAQAGLPNSGSIVGYEIFDQEDTLGATNFSQNVKLVRALEGELSRTISSFDPVEKARVHLVMPQREIFSKENSQPRASVVIKFKKNNHLSKNEIDAISHLIITAVPNLEMKNITIVDNKGNALKIGATEESTDFIAGKNEEAKIANEERLRKVIEDLLSKTVGNGKVKAQVSLEMNFDRVVTNSELYDPDGAVIRSVQSVEEREQTPVQMGANQDVSVANNIPDGGGDDDSGTRFALAEKSDQTTNYEISKIVKNHISESGVISKMSVGILVDGNYVTNQETGEVFYTPRPQEELDKIASLVKVAIGFNEDRNDKIEVINMQFASELVEIEEAQTLQSWLRQELPNLFQTLVFAVVFSLILVTVIRPLALRAFDIRKSQSEFVDSNAQKQAGAQLLNSEIAANSAADHLPGDKSNDIDVTAITHDISIDTDKAIEEFREEKVMSLSKVNRFAKTNPQALVDVLRKWLNEGKV